VLALYQYKIDKEGKLYSSQKDYSNIIKPKKLGEWIDIVYTGKDIYLYLECTFSVSKRDNKNRPETYNISSAELITTDKKLPTKFSGNFSKKTDSDGYNYYEIALGRRFLAVLPFHIQPVMFYLGTDITLSRRNVNGIFYPTI
jgi:hypothetical protein